MSLENKERIRARAMEIGFDVVGFAPAAASSQAGHLDRWLGEGRHGDMAWMSRNPDRRKSVRAVLPEARSVIIVGLNYKAQQTDSKGQGVVAQYARARDYHEVMEGMLGELAAAVREEYGEQTAARFYVDTGPVLERELAGQAGIGWQGKSTMLISKTYGTWLLLGELLVSAAIEADVPSKDHCGSCNRCVAACPTAAITGDYRLDARKCIAYLTIELKGSIPEEFREAIGDRIFGCDDCLTACPWNRFASESRTFKKYQRADLQQLDLVAVLAMDEKQFAEKFAGTPVKRLGLSRLRRNAAVVLGNLYEMDDTRAVTALRDAETGGDMLVAEHARWALTQMERRRKRLENQPAAAA